MAHIAQVFHGWIQAARIDERNHKLAGEVYQAKFKAAERPIICLTALIAFLSALDGLMQLAPVDGSHSFLLRWILFAVAGCVLCATTLMLILRSMKALSGYENRSREHAARSRVLGQFRLRCERAMAYVEYAFMRGAPHYAMETYQALMATRLELVDDARILVLPSHPEIKPRNDMTPLRVPTAASMSTGSGKYEWQPPPAMERKPTPSAHSLSRTMSHISEEGKTPNVSRARSPTLSTMPIHDSVRQQLSMLLHRVRSVNLSHHSSASGSAPPDGQRHGARATPPMFPVSRTSSATPDLNLMTYSVVQQWQAEETMRADVLRTRVRRLQRYAIWWDVCKALPQVLTGIGSCGLFSSNSAALWQEANNSGGSTFALVTGVGMMALLLLHRFMEVVAGELDLRAQAGDAEEHAKQLRGFVDQVQMFLFSIHDLTSTECVAQMHVLCDARKAIRDAYPLAPPLPSGGASAPAAKSKARV